MQFWEVGKKILFSWESLNCAGSMLGLLMSNCYKVVEPSWLLKWGSSWLARQVRNKAGITLGRESKKLVTLALVRCAGNARPLAGLFRSASITESGVAPSTALPRWSVLAWIVDLTSFLMELGWSSRCGVKLSSLREQWPLGRVVTSVEHE